ncbi:murein transglycosylase domain-containing protein [Colwellia sp. MEBiC06753]
MVNENPENVGEVIKQAERSHQAIEQDIQTISQAFAELEALINKRWGKSNSELPSKKKYVKYSNDYQARAVVDFEAGTVVVETIAQKNAQAMLQQAIVTTLLTPADPSKTDIFSSEAPRIGETPFLYDQVLDQDQKAIRYQWRANRYADFLIANELQIQTNAGKTIHHTQFNLVKNHQQLRKLQYSDYVLRSAKQYDIAPSLIYAIIETESSFNPFAVSHANAYGLMQVVPATAGRDVYQKIKNVAGQPSKQTLFDAQKNIDIGTAYLHLLDQRYLNAIINQRSKHYSVISAYNGGAGNVFKTFDKDRNRALRDINKLSEKSVFWALTNKHPSSESRCYLLKVNEKQRKYQ